jgi:hypothetical protein
MLARTFCVPFALLLAATCGAAQEPKPGVYEVTLVTTTVLPTAQVHPPRTFQACLTQDMIDKYNAIVPEQLSNVCQLVNVVKNSATMSADIVCSGRITGKGNVAINWADSEHAKGSIHLNATIHPGQNDIKLEWSSTTTYVYKASDCSALEPSRSPPPAP